MRAMLDELMGEDRDGDRQKCVLPTTFWLWINCCKFDKRHPTQPTTCAGLHATFLMKTCERITSAGFVRMKSLTKLEQTLVPVL